MTDLLPDLHPELAAALVELARQHHAGRPAPAVAVPRLDAERLRVWIEGLGALYGAHPLARRVAWALVGPVDGHDLAAAAFAIQRWVRDHLAYVREAGEQLADPATTLTLGFGDCDDHAVVVGMLCTALGVEWRCRVLYRLHPDGWQRPYHVVAQARIGGRWVDLETTHRDVREGERPEDFMARRGVGL